MIWQFKHRWTSISVCPFCEAKGKGEGELFSEIGDTASWLPTVFTDTWKWAEKMLPQNDLCDLEDFNMGLFGLGLILSKKHTFKLMIVGEVYQV